MPRRALAQWAAPTLNLTAAACRCPPSQRRRASESPLAPPVTVAATRRYLQPGRAPARRRPCDGLVYRPLEARRRDPSTRRLIKGHSRPTASSPMTFTGSRLPERRARGPGLPGAARHSLWLRLPAGTDCPFLKFEFARQQEPSARRLSAAEAAALRCRSVASRGGAVGVLAGASRRLARRRPARVSAPGRVCHLRLVAAAQSVRR